jgi:hypothetical protein
MFLGIIDEEEPNSMEAKAAGLRIKQFDFVFFIVLLSSIFNETSILHKVLQDPRLDIVTALDMVKNCIEKFHSRSTQYDKLYDIVGNICEDNEINIPVNFPIRKRARNDDDQPINARTKYKTIFEDVNNKFFQFMSQRFQTDQYAPIIALLLILIYLNLNSYTIILSLVVLILFAIFS